MNDLNEVPELIKVDEEVTKTNCPTCGKGKVIKRLFNWSDGAIDLGILCSKCDRDEYYGSQGR